MTCRKPCHHRLWWLVYLLGVIALTSVLTALAIRFGG